MAKTTGDVAALAKALAACQREMPDAVKDAKNPHFKSTYATLASVKEAVMPALNKHGFAVTQTFRPDTPAQGVCVITTLIHESGGAIESELFLPVSQADAQKYVAAITYGRRASLAAICGCVADEDDDGNGARPPTQTQQQRDAKPQMPATESQPSAANQHPIATGRRRDIVNRLYAMTPTTMNENARTDAAKGYLAAILPGKTSSAQLDDLDCERMEFALFFLPKVPGNPGRTMQQLVADANSYLASQWTMEPLHQLSKLQIDSARQRIADSTTKSVTQGPNF